MRLACFALVVLGAVRAHAATSIQLEVQGEATAREVVVSSVSELLQRLDVGVNSSPGNNRLATVVVTLGEVNVVLVTDRAGALAERRLVPSGSSVAVTLEAVAHVVQSTVEALLELERMNAQRRLPKAVTPPPIVEAPAAEPSAPASGVGVELGAFVSGRSFGAMAPVVVGGGALVSGRLELGGAWSPRLSLLAAYNGPFSASSELVQVSTQSMTLRLLLGTRFSFGRFSVEGQLGGGVDSLFADARSTTLPRPAVRDQRPISPMLGALLAGRFLLTPSTEVFLAATVDVDLLPRRFVSDIAGERTVLFESARVRPALLLGFSFDVVGTPRVR